MKRLILAGLGALAVVTTMGSANAADMPRRHTEMPVKAPLYEPPFSWTGGGGVEAAIAGPWSAKIEYLYVDLGKGNCDAATCGLATSASLTSSLVRGGINYRF